MTRTPAKTLLAIAFVLGVAIPGLAADARHENLAGFVDGSQFLATAGDDATTVEISLHGAILKALLAIDPELKRLAGGLESIHAVVVDLDESRVDQAMARVRQTEDRLLGKGWERLARVKDASANVSVLVLSDEEMIKGMVVMITDEEEGQLVFANVAGVVDLAAIAALGEQLEIPGLDQVGR